MKTVFIMYEISIPKSNLNDLSQPDMQFNLITSKKNLPNIQKQNIEFFDEIFDLDEVSVESVSEVIKSYSPRVDKKDLYLLTSEENCMMLAAEVRKNLQLQGPKPQNIKCFIDKVEMKAALEGSNIRMPKHMRFDKEFYRKQPEVFLRQVNDLIPYPMLAKPVDHYGAYGVTRIENNKELESWAKIAVDDALNFEVDEFIEGDIYFCNSVIKDGELLYSSVHAYVNAPMLFKKGKVIGEILLLKEHPFWKTLIEYNAEVIEAMSPPAGVTHLEMFYKFKDGLVFLEIAARPPGALAPEAHEKNTGINFEICHFKSMLNMTMDLVENFENAYHAWAYFPCKTGKIIRCNEPEIDCEYTVDWFVEVGDEMEASEEFTVKNQLAGVIRMFDKDYDRLYQSFFQLRDFDATEVE